MTPKSIINTVTITAMTIFFAGQAYSANVKVGWVFWSIVTGHSGIVTGHSD
ncbi:hypothetical protein AAKU58_004274 [Oxalobacteraceae bacterium GrIS 1.18]